MAQLVGTGRPRCLPTPRLFVRLLTKPAVVRVARPSGQINQSGQQDTPATAAQAAADVLGFTSEFVSLPAAASAPAACSLPSPARAERHRLPARAAHVRLRPKEIPTPREPNGNLMRPRKAG